MAKAQSKGESDGHGAVRGRSGLAYFPLAVHGCGAPAPGGSGRPRLPVTPAGLQPSRAPLPTHRGALAVWPLSSTATQRRDQPCPPSETRAAGLRHSGDLACCPWDWGCKETESPLPTPAPRPSSFPRHAIRPGENRGLPRALPSRPVQLGLTRGRSAPRTPG